LPHDIDNTEAGDEVIEFAKRFGMVLDDWQEWVVRHMCAEDSEGNWAATQSVLLVPRQAGKSAILEVLEMAALFLWNEQHIIYSAHLGKTATDHMRRMRRHIKAVPEYDRLCRVLTGKGDERVERTDTGAILEFITRGKKSSRGGSPNRVIFDEAMFLAEDQIQAMLPALSAQSMNVEGAPQMVYTSSAPIAESQVLHRLRRRALDSSPPRMFFAEWSCHEDSDVADRDNWYQANPGLGIRISEEWIEDNE
jgi:phage terminase large subunit-like protein